MKFDPFELERDLKGFKVFLYRSLERRRRHELAL
jgi:hypothetical protein